MNILKEIPEMEIKEAVLHEYKRKLIVYRLACEKLSSKYGMSFDEFEKGHVVKEKNFPGMSNQMQWNGNIQLKE